MSVSHSDALNSAGACDTGDETVFLFAGGVVWLWESTRVSVVCGMAFVSKADEDAGEEITAGTETGLTKVVGKVTAGGYRHR